MAKFFNLFPSKRRKNEQDLDRELKYHVERRIEDMKRSGLSEADARRAAALEFGGMAQVKDEVRDTWIWRWLDNMIRDLRFAGRTLSRSPGFAATALLSLALGIGGSAAIFSLIDQVLLRSLPVTEPERLVQMDWTGNYIFGNSGGGHQMSYSFCRDLQEQEQFFDGVFCRHPTMVLFSAGQEQSSVRAEMVSGAYFTTLGVVPELGRLIDRSDDLLPESHPVVVLSYSYWKDYFAGAQDVVGRKVLINQYPMTVIGIAPESFVGMDPLIASQLWIPAMMTLQAEPEVGRQLENRWYAWMHVFGRVKPGVTVEQAEAALAPWFKSALDADTRRDGFPAINPEERRNFLASTIDLLPGARGVSDARAALKRPLLVVMGGTLVLLLLASLNVAGLLLARGAARSQELTTRLAIGATRGRVIGQLLSENMLITLGGGLLGLAAAPIVSQALISLLSQQGDLHAQFDYRVFLFAFLAMMVSGALCGFAPALQPSRIPLIASLKERSNLATVGGVRLRKALVVAQMALTLVLLIGAGLFVRTLARLHENVGFSSGTLLMFGIDPPSSGYSETKAEQVMREVYRRLPDMPGVESAALANTRLLTGGWSTRVLTIQSDERIVSDRPVPFMRVTPGFFPTLGTQVIAGRDFDQRDERTPGTPPRDWQSVIVNESFARKYFKDRNPVGHRVGVGNRPDTVTNIEIIGVVRDFSRRNLRDEDIEQVFFPYWDRLTDNGAFYVRMRGKPESAFASVSAMVGEIDRTLPVLNPTTFDDQIDRSLWTERALATLSSGFGAIALLLSIIGLYGVMSFVVTKRTQEIGIRVALGATPGGVVWLIVRDSLVMIAAGMVIAFPVAWALRRLVEAQLFGVSVVDGPTIAIASGVLALVALGAAMLPAWRAACLNPNVALRLE